MTKTKRVCVYCGASTRVDEVYRQTALRLGEMLAKSGMDLVYGGGRLGLMGLVADSALANGAHVIGYIPKILESFEGSHSGLSYLEVVDTMHTRKRKMAEIANAFVILPGGFGTLDELFEILTWRQLNMHNKQIIIINTNDYWTPLKNLIHNIIEEKFATPTHAMFAIFVDNVDEAIEKLIEYPEIDVGFEGQNV